MCCRIREASIYHLHMRQPQKVCYTLAMADVVYSAVINCLAMVCNANIIACEELNFEPTYYCIYQLSFCYVTHVIIQSHDHSHFL